MNKPDGGPAFPGFEHFICERVDSKGPVKVITGQPHGGITVRDYFAGQAMQGAMHEYLTGSAWEGYADFTESCYRVADAMLRERDK